VCVGATRWLRRRSSALRAARQATVVGFLVKAVDAATARGEEDNPAKPLLPEQFVQRLLNGAFDIVLSNEGVVYTRPIQDKKAVTLVKPKLLCKTFDRHKHTPF
jgi:hypothetical protein